MRSIIGVCTSPPEAESFAQMHEFRWKREREGEEGDREETTYVSSSTRGRRIYNGITFPRLYFGSKNAVSVPISSLPFSSIRTSMLFCETNSGPSSAPLA